MLQRLCCVALEAGRLVHPLGSDRLFSVLQYADDTLIFIKNSDREIINFKFLLMCIGDVRAKD